MRVYRCRRIFIIQIFLKLNKSIHVTSFLMGVDLSSIMYGSWFPYFLTFHCLSFKICYIFTFIRFNNVSIVGLDIFELFAFST